MGASDGGAARLAPLGVPVVPLVRMMIRECAGRLRGGRLAAARDQVGQGLVGAARRLVLVRVLVQCAQLSQRRLGLGHRLGVLVVVDDDRGALALGHLFDLRAGELAVEQDQPGTRTSRPVERNQEPAVVADQHRDPVAALHTHGEQTVGHGVGGVVEFLERHLTVVVDDGHPVGRATRVEGGNHADLAPSPDIGDHADEILRWLDLQCAGFEHLARVVQFSRPAVDILLQLRDGLNRQFHQVGHDPHLSDRRHWRVGKYHDNHGSSAGVGGGRPRGIGDPSGQGDFSGTQRHQAGSDQLLPRGRRWRAARRRGAPDDPEAVRQGHRHRGHLPEACTREAAGLDRRGRTQVPVRNFRQGGRPARRGRPGVGGEPRLHRPQPAPGAGRRPRPPR